jgi:type II secretory ATPase GspE/PulE/Tfp pilus assembly ATPase PilB-like protein
MGEKVVLRILDRSVLKTKLEELGMTSEMAKTLNELITKPSGLLLLTGPTGCGKTTTVYSLIELFNKVEKNLITIEDPVEYRVDNITQVQVHNKAGITFPSALRSMLRQDPDVIIIGEIRDRETAEIAIRAALTGHLVISTLHTNDSLAAIHRLMDMGVEPYLIASSLLGILSQRLVRVLCPKCKKQGHPLESQMKLLKTDKVALESTVGCSGQGCKFCSQAAFKGRVGIFEFLVSNPEVKELITLRKSAREISTLLRANGFKSIRDEGIEKALAGFTTLEEVLRQTI